MADVSITGVQEVDRRFRLLEPKLEKKIIRKGLRNGAKIVKKATADNLRGETHGFGAMAKALTVRAAKRRKGRIGILVEIPADKLFAIYTSLYGHPPNPRAGETRPFYYPQVVELGGSEQTEKSPMRRGLATSRQAVVSEFVSTVTEMVREA